MVRLLLSVVMTSQHEAFVHMPDFSVQGQSSWELITSMAFEPTSEWVQLGIAMQSSLKQTNISHSVCNRVFAGCINCFSLGRQNARNENPT